MSNEGRICPQCGYGRQPKDLAPDYECPRCGIIYAKYVPPKPADPEPVMIKPEPTDGPVPASLLRRALAGIYTGAKGGYYTALMAIPVYYGYQFICYLTGKDFFSQFETVTALYNIIAVLVGLYAFFFYPCSHTETWGQKEFGLTIAPLDNPRGDLRWTHWLLRYVGNVAAFFVFPLTLAGFFYGLYIGKDFLSIADRLSMTRQYETGKPAIRFRYAVSRAFTPAIIGFFIYVAVVAVPTALGLLYVKSLETRRIAHIDSPEAVKTRKAAKQEMKEKIIQNVEAMAYQNTINLLSELEQRHYSDHSDYTEDLEALINQYANNKGNAVIGLLPLIRDGSIRAQKTAGGIELWVQTHSGDWASRELRR